MNKKQIFENVQFLNEGLFGFGPKVFYKITSYEKDEINPNAYYYGCQNEKEAIVDFFKADFRSKNGSYIVNKGAIRPKYYMYKYEVTQSKMELQTAGTNFSRKLACAKGKDIKNMVLLKTFESLRDLADTVSIKITIEDNTADRKKALKDAKTILRSFKLIRIDFENDVVNEEFFEDGFDDSILLGTIDISEEQSTNNAFNQKLEDCCEMFNKSHENFNLDIDWDKYEGSFFLSIK